MYKEKKPLYIQIYEDLKEKIFSNFYENDTFLPSERELSEEYNVERATIRRALALLAKEELISKLPGSGSKVNNITQPKYQTPSEEYNNIAYILPGDAANKITQPFHSSVFYRFEMECKAHGFNLFYINLKGDYTLPDIILNKHVKGVVWVSSIPTDLLEYFLTLNIPSILISTTHPKYVSILADNISGSIEAVQHLINLGHRNIAFINGTETYQNSVERKDGYTRVLKQANIPVDEQLIFSGDWSFESGYRETIRLIDSKKTFTAIFAANDMMALGAQSALISRGFVIPDQISVIGFDNIEQCKYSIPALTTVSVDAKIFAKQMMNSLLSIINTQETIPVKILIPTTLTIRNSTSAPQDK